MKITYGSQKVTIDLQAIKLGLMKIAKNAGVETYKDLADDSKAIIAFGMAPVEVVESFSTQFKTMVVTMLKETVAKKVGATGSDFYEIISKETIKETMGEMDKEFYLGLLAGATEEGKLLV